MSLAVGIYPPSLIGPSARWPTGRLHSARLPPPRWCALPRPRHTVFVGTPLCQRFILGTLFFDCCAPGKVGAAGGCRAQSRCVSQALALARANRWFILGAWVGGPVGPAAWVERAGEPAVQRGGGPLPFFVPPTGALCPAPPYVWGFLRVQGLTRPPSVKCGVLPAGNAQGSPLCLPVGLLLDNAVCSIF